jgi:hypothetical protein
MNYEQIKRHSAQFVSVTGLTVAQFDELIKSFELEWDIYITHFTLEGKLRCRRSRKVICPSLPTADHKLFFLLTYLKNNPLQEQLAASFSMTQPKANMLIHRLSYILRKALKRLGELPYRNEYQLEHLLKSCQHVLLDGTERPIVRPKDAERQKAHYSGKKKTHEVKNNVLTLPDRRIVWMSKTYQGSVHDKKICDLQPLLLPKGITLWQDTGFQGYNPESVNVNMPTRKPKGKELTEEQKQTNRTVSSIRVLVEHAIGGAKRCRIIKDRFRCHKLGFDDLVMELACGLHNLRITLTQKSITA